MDFLKKNSAYRQRKVRYLRTQDESDECVELQNSAVSDNLDFVNPQADEVYTDRAQTISEPSESDKHCAESFFEFIDVLPASSPGRESSTSRGQPMSTNESLNDGNLCYSSDLSVGSTFSLPRSPVAESPAAQEEINMRTILKNWAIDNITNMKTCVVTSLLKRLKDVGYSELPASGATLMGFSHAVRSCPMISKSNKIGDYIYLGIQNGLEKCILPDVFNEREIQVLVHIDGMTIYSDTDCALWPILIKLYHKDYTCSPFVAALYYGPSKPKDVELYLGDFVEEARNLTMNGVTIQGRSYAFKIAGIIGDGPARAYIKCVKGPTGYYACERCTVPGETVHNRRIYPDMNASERTKESIIARIDRQHQPKAVQSPLLRIPGFDPIKDVPQESMHALYLNLMKNLLTKWLDRSSQYRISVQKLNILKSSMDEISLVPTEFQ